jgi:acyl carrier protein
MKQIKIKKNLKPQHEAFVIAYTTPGTEFCGLAYRAYSEAYSIVIPKNDAGDYCRTTSEYTVCQAAGSRLLLREDIQNRIKQIYTDYLDDSNVDARLSEILRGGKDTDSIQAIKIYNDLKQRITKKFDVQTNARPLLNLSDEELEALLD